MRLIGGVGMEVAGSSFSPAWMEVTSVKSSSVVSGGAGRTPGQPRRQGAPTGGSREGGRGWDEPSAGGSRCRSRSGPGSPGSRSPTFGNGPRGWERRRRRGCGGLVALEEDRQSGFFVCQDRFGVERQFHLMTVSISIICSDTSNYESAIAISHECAKMKEHLKRLPGSNYLIDRRRGKS